MNATALQTESYKLETRPARIFEPYPNNRKITDEAVQKMTESIREIGVMQPILARHATFMGAKQETLEIIAGECRWRGCKAIDADFPVPVFIREVSDKEAAKMNAVENLQRTDLDEVEEARVIQNMQHNGWTLDEIGQTLGFSKGYLSRRLSLLKLSDEAHQAIREKNLSVATAAKIASLPEEVQHDALTACVSPTHSATALPEKAALELLDRKFVEPAKRAQEWKERRSVLEHENPDAVWTEYEEVLRMGDYSSSYKVADERPDWADGLSDAAKEGELVIPTWGELADRHGARKYIGFRNQNFEVAVLFVEAAALIDAEKAAHNANPEECIFTHDLAVRAARAAAEKRKHEEEARLQALIGEQKKFVETVLGTGGVSVSATKERKLAARLARLLAKDDVEPLETVLGVNPDAEDMTQAMELAIERFFKDKSVSAFELLGRLWAAVTLETYGVSYGYGQEKLARLAFGDGALKATDFPALAQVAARFAAEPQEEEEAAA
jgi:ParB/RepB/Spo0J family partition protein